MKLSKLFSKIFGVLGAALLVFSLALCLICRNGEPRLAQPPKEAGEASAALMDALSQGDYTAASALLYGQPDLGADGAPEDPAAALVWEAFTGSISYQFSGNCYMAGTDVCQDVTITLLDVPGVIKAIPDLSQSLMAQKAANAAEPEEIYSEDGEYLPQVVDQVMLDAARQAIAEAGTVSYDGTLRMFQQNGRWTVIPDRTLLRAISGGL